MSRCAKTRSDGQPCRAQAVDGTDACRVHAGRSLAAQRAKGAVVVELRSWGLDEELVDSTQAMLRLLAQAFRRAQRYSQLLAEAYAAAERLRQALDVTPGMVPGQRATAVDAERAAADLDRVFTQGGVAALVGYKYGAAGKDGNLYVAEEAIRGLARLEAEERDRAFRFAEKCRAADLDGRLVALAEGQSALVADFLADVLGALDGLLAAGQLTSLSPSDPQVMRVLSQRMAALGSAA